VVRRMCGAWRCLWQAGCECGCDGDGQVDLVNDSRAVVEGSEVFRAFLSGRGDEFEEGFVSECVVSDCDDQCRASQQCDDDCVTAILCWFYGGGEAGGGGSSSECQPAVQVVPWEADSGQLIADRGVKSVESLFGDAGDDKEGGAADPRRQQQAGGCGGNVSNS